MVEPPAEAKEYREDSINDPAFVLVGSFLLERRTKKLKTKAVKTEQLEEIRRLWKESGGFVIIDTQLMKAAPITDARRQCRKAGVTLAVFKNTLVQIVARENGLESQLEKYLKGPSAFAFAEEAPVAAKTISEIAKKYSKFFKVKGAYSEGQVLSEAGAKALAALPTRQEMLGQVAATFQAPISSFARALNGTIVGFARVVKAYADQKAEGGSPEPSPEPTPEQPAETPAEAA